MSGLFGIVAFDSYNIRNDALLHLTTKFIEENQIAGFDTSGIVFNTDDSIQVLKTALRGTRFVLSKEYEMLTKRVFLETNVITSILGINTNLKSLDKNIIGNANNIQPFIKNNILSCITGNVLNDKYIFDHELHSDNDVLSKRFERKGMLNNEAAASLVSFLSEGYKETKSENTPVTKALVKTLKILSGTFSGSFIDKSNPTCVWLINGNSDVEVVFFKKDGILLFANSLNTINKVITSVQYKYKDILSQRTSIVLRPYTGLCFNTAFATYDRFDLQINDKEK